MHQRQLTRSLQRKGNSVEVAQRSGRVTLAAGGWAAAAQRQRSASQRLCAAVCRPRCDVCRPRAAATGGVHIRRREAQPPQEAGWRSAAGRERAQTAAADAQLTAGTPGRDEGERSRRQPCSSRGPCTARLPDGVAAPTASQASQLSSRLSQVVTEQGQRVLQTQADRQAASYSTVAWHRWLCPLCAPSQEMASSTATIYSTGMHAAGAPARASPTNIARGTGRRPSSPRDRWACRRGSPVFLPVGHRGSDVSAVSDIPPPWLTPDRLGLASSATLAPLGWNSLPP